MEDKLVTLAILTYTKAQILKNVLENEGIETYIHNVNQIQPVVSSGVRLRIKESDLPRALKITESSTWLSESIVGEKEPKVKDKSNKILIPVDFSNYSMKACEFAFNLAKTENAEVILLHVYFTPIYASSLPYGDVFNYQIGDEESVKTIIQKVHSDLNALSEKIKEKVTSGEFPNVKYSCILREGIPEEEILRKEYFHKQYPGLEIHYDVVMNDNLLKGLDQYIKDNHIDIITLTSYKRNIFARLFNPSIARKMIFHSDTPLLVINS
ncbi:universal stress protein [Bacteroides ovatus]|uniref:universal stress protein n=1 Tax=Bacteroides ovatus TaxID=28116 RepID=UPI00189F1013|nr:universal stress protein [Bacteroides ovatus]